MRWSRPRWTVGRAMLATAAIALLLALPGMWGHWRACRAWVRLLTERAQSDRAWAAQHRAYAAALDDPTEANIARLEASRVDMGGGRWLGVTYPREEPMTDAQRRAEAAQHRDLAEDREREAHTADQLARVYEHESYRFWKAAPRPPF